MIGIMPASVPSDSIAGVLWAISLRSIALELAQYSLALVSAASSKFLVKNIGGSGKEPPILGAPGTRIKWVP
jgi:hypothetical protein